MYSQKDFEFSVYSEKIRELLGDIEENNKKIKLIQIKKSIKENKEKIGKYINEEIINIENIRKDIISIHFYAYGIIEKLDKIINVSSEYEKIIDNKFSDKDKDNLVREMIDNGICKKIFDIFLDIKYSELMKERHQLVHEYKNNILIDKKFDYEKYNISIIYSFIHMVDRLCSWEIIMKNVNYDINNFKLPIIFSGECQIDKKLTNFVGICNASLKNEEINFEIEDNYISSNNKIDINKITIKITDPKLILENIKKLIQEKLKNKQYNSLLFSVPSFDVRGTSNQNNSISYPFIRSIRSYLIGYYASQKYKLFNKSENVFNDIGELQQRNKINLRNYLEIIKINNGLDVSNEIFTVKKSEKDLFELLSKPEEIKDDEIILINSGDVNNEKKIEKNTYYRNIEGHISSDSNDGNIITHKKDKKDKPCWFENL